MPYYVYFVLYDNGVIRSPAHNNQSRAVDVFWPFTVYQYHPDTDTYDRISRTNAWDKREGADWDGVPVATESQSPPHRNKTSSILQTPRRLQE